MLSGPGYKFRRFGAFKVFDRPISPIAPEPQDDPTWFLRLNEDWMTIANGALGALARPETWAAETQEGSAAMVENGHYILDLWQPWSQRISVPDWELYTVAPGQSNLFLAQRGENATGPFYVYCFLQTVGHHFKFRDIVSHADVGGLLTVARGRCTGNDFAQIIASVTPCNGAPIPFSTFLEIDLVGLMGGPFEARELEFWSDTYEICWQFVLKNNWVCGQV